MNATLEKWAADYGLEQSRRYDSWRAWQAAIASLEVTPELVEAACRGHWKSWGRMRPDHERAHRADMSSALTAVFAKLKRSV